MNTLMKIMGAVLVAALSTMWVDSVAATKILFHGREDVAVRGDIFAMQHLETLYGAENVTYAQGSAAAADGSDADGFDVVVLSSTMSSSHARGKYEQSTVGIVTWESALIRSSNPGNFFVSENATNKDYGLLTFPIQIDIVDENHPLAAGLSGTVDVLVDNAITQDTGVQFGYGLTPGEELGAGVDLVATATNPIGEIAKPLMIFAADVGAALLGDGVTENPPGFTSPATAAGRRVMFFLSDYGFENLTADGLSLFDAAIDWAAAQPDPADFNEDGRVDGLDLAKWQGDFGVNDQSDADGDGDSDGNDILIWQRNLTGAPAFSAVPEPSTFGLLTFAGLALALLRKRIT